MRNDKTQLHIGTFDLASRTVILNVVITSVPEVVNQFHSSGAKQGILPYNMVNILIAICARIFWIVNYANSSERRSKIVMIITIDHNN